MTHDIPTPENCPEPYWHETHHYCPCCSWVNPDRPKSPVERLQERVTQLETMLTNWRESEDEPDDELCRAHDEYLAAHESEVGK